jgi:glutamine amidotransferase
VIFASEQMDENPTWRELQPGELVHVDPDLDASSTFLIDRPPVHQLRLEDLRPQAAASQRDPRSPRRTRSA